jgi:hypothetical protein
VTGRKKLEIMTAILNFMRAPSEVPEALRSALDHGFLNPGTFYLTRRDVQLSFLIEFGEAWKALSTAEQTDCLADPWSFKRFLFGLPIHSAYAQREGLLHLVHKDTFEAIVSREHKQLIVKRFGSRPDDPDSDIDQQLEAARAELTATYFAASLPAGTRMPLRSWRSSTMMRRKTKGIATASLTLNPAGAGNRRHGTVWSRANHRPVFPGSVTAPDGAPTGCLRLVVTGAGRAGGSNVGTRRERRLIGAFTGATVIVAASACTDPRPVAVSGVPTEASTSIQPDTVDLTDSGLLAGNRNLDTTRTGFVKAGNAAPVDLIEPRYAGSTVSAANESGVVVGMLGQVVEGIDGVPFRWKAVTGLEALPLPPGSDHADATDVAEDGTIVVNGYSGDVEHSRPFLWDPDTRTYTGLSTFGAGRDAALAINRAGLVVGRSNVVITYQGQSVITQHAVAWAPGSHQPTDLDPDALAESQANDVNDSGVIVGEGSDRTLSNHVAIMWAGSGVPRLEEPRLFSARAVNNAGVAVGFATDAEPNRWRPARATVWDISRGTVTSLPDFGGHSVATGIDSRSEAVGIAASGNSPPIVFFVVRWGAFRPTEPAVPSAGIVTLA